MPARLPRVVAIGGGHGLARALEALRRLGLAPTAVVTVADDGGSSGRLRRDLGIIAPGDLRMALLTLARNRPLAAALAHRFARGQLEGHALGNLVLVALAEQAGGDFVAALDRAAQLLDCAGRVLPATAQAVRLKARVAGEEVDGQVRVAAAQGRIDRVWLEPADPPVTREAATAVNGADLVVLGPGSLFTSVLANLLVPGLARALTTTAARVVYVGNILTQPGETAGLDAQAHVDALLDHLPGLRLGAVVLHDGPVGAGEGDPLGVALSHPRVDEVLRADLVARDAAGAVGWGHDPERLAAALAPLVDRAALAT
ncbi:MAG TPA: gluconeogenesis factor YvcK family protein [Egibacteraceae bacterium]|jgi:uncharacterized cofD-like protein|nr:gluconeogenesis factor YvcK family protein [Egibacteraceae bacterium]